MLRDHISYLANREECVSALVSLCAAFDGSGSDRWEKNGKLGLETDKVH